jgi:hypothetical protein
MSAQALQASGLAVRRFDRDNEIVMTFAARPLRHLAIAGQDLNLIRTLSGDRGVLVPGCRGGLREATTRNSVAERGPLDFQQLRCA